MLHIKSKLPQIGTTIFTVVSQRAGELGALNLAQGFPDFDPPARLQALVSEHMARGHNQYAPMGGIESLRVQIANMSAQRTQRVMDPDTEVTVTLGATEALFSAILALVHTDDEVIVFDPAYDAYEPAIALAGGRTIHIPLRLPDFHIDWQQVRDALTSRTRMIIINSPHNPTGAILQPTDLAALAALLRDTEVLVLSDEVYEYMVFDGRSHHSVQAHAELAARSLSVHSFGKTLHATGFRVGYALAPAAITQELRRVHQFNVFSIAAPLQYAIADFMHENPSHFDELSMFYQHKRDYFLKLLQGSPWRWTPSCGSYFQLLDYAAISAQNDYTFADELLSTAGVASIPLSPFYATPPTHTLLRFCFAKSEHTLDQAVARLRSLSAMSGE